MSGVCYSYVKCTTGHIVTYTQEIKNKYKRHIQNTYNNIIIEFLFMSIICFYQIVHISFMNNQFPPWTLRYTSVCVAIISLMLRNEMGDIIMYFLMCNFHYMSTSWLPNINDHS